MSQDYKETIVNNDIHSGNSECTNTSTDTCVDKEDIEPVPPGIYNISKNNKAGHEGWWALQDKNWIPNVSGLAHKLGLKRAGFNIHLGTASNGCITLHKDNDKTVDFFNKLSEMFTKDKVNTIRVMK